MPSLSQVCWMVEEGAELRCTMSCPPATQTLNTALYLHPVHLYYHQILVIVLDLSSALLRSKRSTLHCNRLYSSERDSLQIIKHSLCKVVPFPFLPGPSNLEAIWVPSSKKLLAATSSGNYTHCNAFLMFGWAISIWKPENCFETTSHWLSKVDTINAIPNYNLKVSKSWSLSYYNLIYKLYYTGNSKPCQRTHIQDSHTRDTSVDIWSECFAGNIDEAAKIKTQGRKTGMWLSNVNFSWFSPGLLNISSDLKWDDTGAHRLTSYSHNSTNMFPTIVEAEPVKSIEMWIESSGMRQTTRLSSVIMGGDRRALPTWHWLGFSTLIIASFFSLSLAPWKMYHW